MTQQLILSGGIFSDIEAWESSNGQDGLANKLARDEGRDVWEIEMTGGPIGENESSLDYTYQNLVEDYWPALLGAVQYYTGKITMDYVGHSNGCRAALSSLKDYQTTGKSNVGIVQNLITGNNQTVSLQGNSGAHVVNTFVGVACPGELNELTIFSSATRYNVLGGLSAGDATMNLISSSHTTLRNYGTKLMLVSLGSPLPSAQITFIISLFTGSDKISRNLIDFYNDLSIEPNSNFSLSGLNISKVRLYYSNYLLLGNDAIVPVEDMYTINNSMVSSDKRGEVLANPFLHHSGIKDSNTLKEEIISELR